MEYQQHCLASNSDATKGNQAFMGTVVSKFTPEGFHMLRRYLGTMPDVKNVINLHLRAQKFTEAGITMARRAFSKKSDSREKQTILAVRLWKRKIVLPCAINRLTLLLTSLIILGSVASIRNGKRNCVSKILH